MRHALRNCVQGLFTGGLLIMLTGTASGVPVVAMSDQAISREIRLELANDDAVAGHYIDISVENGYVTLSGSVDNLLSRDLAEKLCGGIRGVRGIINKLEVIPVERNETILRADVNMALLQFPVTELLKLSSSVRNDTVILGGTAHSLSEKELAAGVIKGVKGVRAIENTIKVIPLTQRSDGEIKEEVQGLLESDPFLHGTTLQVHVKRGIVRIEGKVGNYAEKMFARSDAYVDGAVAVIDSGITVKLWAENPFRREVPLVVKPDSEMVKELKALFSRDPRTAPYPLKIAVNGGIVTLEGTVGTIEARRRAEEIAFSIVGIYRVINYVKVRPVTPVSNAELEQRLAASVQRDPIVDRHELKINVRNGMAYVYGTVDGRYERNHVEAIIERIPGIVAIGDYLYVRTDNRDRVHKTDSMILDRILDRYRYQYLIDPSDLKVTVKDGIATVTGKIESTAEWRAIVKNAFDAGADVVVTRLLFNGIRLNEEYDHENAYLLNSPVHAMR